jgi:predicted  nucleic acid-binding Zn-ribbon protein
MRSVEDGLRAEFDDRLAAVRDEYAKAAESWDRSRSRLYDERDELRAEVERLGERVAYYRDSEVPALRNNADGWAARAEAAEDAVARLRALADEWEYEDRYDAPTGDRLVELRAALTDAEQATR